MSSQSKKSTSWFTRLGSTFGRKRRSTPSDQNRRGLRFESLETRSLLSATMLPTISGIVYQDVTGNGLTSDDFRLANATINLFRDGGDGVFEGKNVGSDDTQVASVFSDASGKYKFDNLSLGTYFVQEVGVPGLVITPGQNVQKVVVTNSDLQGTTGTTIDSFSSTSQYVSGSLHGGKTGTSSQPAPDAIGGHRNLYVQLTSAKGSVSLGANSDFPGLIDFASGSASNGIFWVNWDGNNGNAAVLNPTGLGQVDITSQDTSTGIRLTIAADHDNGFIMLKVFSDASNWSWTSVPISNTSDGSLSDSQFAAFSDFTIGGGTGANFSKVGAIQLAINGVNANDGQVGPIQAAGPKIFSNINFANLAQADLAVVKSATPSPAVAGNQLTYTFTTTNNGVSGATGVTLADMLPAGVHYVSSSSSQGMVANNSGTLSVQLGSLAAGASATTNIIVTVDPSATGSITNTVTVVGNEPDPNLLNNTSTVTTQINRSVDLAIIKTATPDPVKAGKQLTYTLTATNNGPSDATGVSIVDTLPIGTSYYSASGQSSTTIVDHTLTLNVGNLATGASSTIIVVVDVASTTSGTIINTAVVSGNEPDPNLANNTASVSTRVDVPIIPLATTDLKIVKTASPNPVTIGSNLTYTLIVSNNSDTTATFVTVVDTLPVGFAYLSASTSGSPSSYNNGVFTTLTWNLGSMAPQASETITIVGTVTAAAASTITNTAVVSSHEKDGNEADNTSSVVTTVIRPVAPPPTKYHALGR
ncbi:MAG: SpaA isopeptide-forming pilin-related protein [Planctomycetota bacterium]